MKNKTTLLRHIYFVTVLAFFLFATIGCKTEVKQEGEMTSTEDLVAAAAKVDSLYLVHFNNGDVEGMMNLHWNSPELISYPSGEMKIKGYEAVKEAYRKDFTINKGARLSYLEIYNVPIEGAVMGYGIFKWSIAREGSAPEEITGRYSDVKAFKDGKMVILLDHSSLPTPPAPAVDSTEVE